MTEQPRDGASGPPEGAEQQRTGRAPGEGGPVPRRAAGATSRARRIGGRLPPASAPIEPDAAGPAAGPAGDDATPELEPETLAAAEPEASADATTAAPQAVPGWLLWLPAGVLAAACIVLVVFGVLAGSGVWWGAAQVDVAKQRDQVLAAAKTCMATMNSYDYRKLDQAEAQGLACTTGALTGQYRQAMEKLIKPQAAKVQFTQTAQVNNAGIEQISQNGRQWTVLIFGQLSTTNSQTGTSTPKLSVFSARVSMQQVDGRWLVANYEYAPPS
jgi:Mce-associated membrane protein